MRILIATARRNLLGGVEKYLQTVIPGLIEREHTIGLLYEYRFNPSDEAIDSRAARLPVWCLEELGLDALLHSLQDWTPDVVYSHGLDDTDLERALLDTFPVMLYAHTYYGTCVSGRKCHAVPRLQPCGRKLGAGCLVLYYPRRCGDCTPARSCSCFRPNHAAGYRWAIIKGYWWPAGICTGSWNSTESARGACIWFLCTPTTAFPQPFRRRLGFHKGEFCL